MNDRFHDSYGNRMKLDTRHLVWCAEHKAQELIDRKEREEKERKDRMLTSIIRLAIVVPCGAFALAHIRILYMHPMEVLEAGGVIACLTFVADTIASFWRER